VIEECLCPATTWALGQKLRERWELGWQIQAGRRTMKGWPKRPRGIVGTAARDKIAVAAARRKGRTSVIWLSVDCSFVTDKGQRVLMGRLGQRAEAPRDRATTKERGGAVGDAGARTRGPGPLRAL
jgi:hypothetical protein